MIDNQTVERIFAATDIVDVVNDFVTLRKKGVNYTACCPFHNEKTPSFIVSPAKGFFKCFGCGKGGNAVTFVMEHERMTYPEALKYLAHKYNIEVEENELSDEQRRRNDDRESMMTLNAWASDYFSRCLTQTDDGRSVGMQYLAKRGFTDATIRRFGLGYCPSGGTTMTDDAIAAGYKEQYLTATGLSIKRDNGTGCFDRFRGRVMFPIHTVSGRVIGFGGRTMHADDRAKYVNSPESAVYNKSATLYGIWHAKQAITRENFCILVEGYADVIQMHQKGIENVVASSGTSLTTEQIRLISRFTHNITLIYDGDKAGVKAAIRGTDMILKEGLNIRIVLLPPDDDPDSFARSHTTEQIRDYIASNEEDFIHFKTNLLLEEAGDDPIKRAQLINQIVDSVAVVPDNVQRAVFIQQTAAMMQIQEQVLVDAVAQRNVSSRFGREESDYLRNKQAFERRKVAEAERLASLEGIVAGSSSDEMERELVYFMVRYGEQWFEYKVASGQTSQFNVAQTIIEDLTKDGIVFQNAVYKTIYDLYCQQYTQLGVGVKVPEQCFVNYPDAEVCNTVIDIITDDTRYVESAMWREHDIFFDNDEKLITAAVPRLVLLYKSKVACQIIAQLQERLADENLTDEQQEELLMQITSLNRIRIEVAKLTDRPITL